MLPVLQALELGKPVLVEKPIALRLEDADRMISTAAKTGADLRIGYSRAARIIEALEEKGVIGPADGSRPREVLVSGMQDLGIEDNRDAADELDLDDNY